MSTEDSDDYSHLSLLELFRIEVEGQAVAITDGLLELERDPSATHRIEGLMRSAHSLKGAARIVNRDSAVRLAHAMEDCFLAVQRGTVVLQKRKIDLLLRAIDLLTRSAHIGETELGTWQAQHRSEIQILLDALSSVDSGDEPDLSAPVTSLAGVVQPTRPIPSDPASAVVQDQAAIPDKLPEFSNRVLRISPESFNRLLGLSAEMVVGSHWLDAFTTELLRLRRLHNGLSKSLNRLNETLVERGLDEEVQVRLADVQSSAARSQDALTSKIEELEQFDVRFAGLSKRLYQGVLECRMRPFADGIRGFPRMVRDVAHSLGKQVKLDILGDSTPVDRDILERLEAPLGHLLRNAVDHGIEHPEDRRQNGKPEVGTLRLEAHHSSGMLFINVADDGQGLDPQRIRQALVRKDLATVEMAEKLTESELLEFLFLPGFTLKERVTEISGRGVGLDVVQVMTREIGGSVRLFSKPGRGTTVELRLPLTLSVLRALLVEIDGEPYAFPLSRINSVLKVNREQVEVVEGREHVTIGSQQVGLVSGQQILGSKTFSRHAEELSVVVLGREGASYGVVVD
ncbi:MAG: chemotaxis protein CheA, partial [Verrucomicrobiaceae bacterium]